MLTPPQPPSEPARQRWNAQIVKWVIFACLVAAVIIIRMVDEPRHRESRYRHRPPLPNADNAESHPQPAWVLDRG